MTTTRHTIIIGNSQQTPETPDASVHLMITSPPYPMIQMWDKQFSEHNPKIAELWRKLEAEGKKETVTEIYDASSKCSASKATPYWTPS